MTFNQRVLNSEEGLVVSFLVNCKIVVRLQDANMYTYLAWIYLI